MTQSRKPRRQHSSSQKPATKKTKHHHSKNQKNGKRKSTNQNQVAQQGLKVGDQETVEISGWSHAGEGVGRLQDGRAVFVPDTIPGETVALTITQVKKRFARADCNNIVSQSPHRVNPECVHYNTCGGCQLQHIAPAHQLELKQRTIIEQLQKIGGIADPPVLPTRRPTVWPYKYRNHGRFAASPSGAPGFSQKKTNNVATIPHCLVLQDSVLDLYHEVGTNWAGIRGIELFTGDTLPYDRFAIVYPGKDGVPAAPQGDFGYSLQTVGDPAVLREPNNILITISPSTVEPFTLRVSPGAFFQSGPSPAALLVDTVLEFADVSPGETVIDLYSGVGLLTIPLARSVGSTGHITAVELSSVATDDAVANAIAHDLPITIVHDDTLHWLEQVELQPQTIAVLDPPRAGAGKEVCEMLQQQKVEKVVLVSCDVGAMARDANHLTELGYQLVTAVGLDLFAQTAHVEVVSLFILQDGFK